MADPDIVLEDLGGKVPIAHATIISNGPYEVDSVMGFEQGGSSTLTLPLDKTADLKDTQIRKLREQGFPAGLAQAMNGNKSSFPLRIWVRNVFCVSIVDCRLCYKCHTMKRT